MKVELDVFSGRSNPSWKLSTQEVVQLRRLLRKLPEIRTNSAEAGEEPSLGYRGFRLEADQTDNTLPFSIKVYAGTITIQNVSTELSTRYSDVNELEKWLAQQAHKYGYGNLVSHLIDDSL